MTEVNLTITKEQLFDALLIYFQEEVEACPMNATSFCHYLLDKYRTGGPYDCHWCEGPTPNAPQEGMNGEMQKVMVSFCDGCKKAQEQPFCGTRRPIL
jgi:hypothetical protein